MKRPARTIGVTIVIALSFPSAWSQDQKSETPTFSSTSQLVVIPANVSDKAGQYFPNLQKGEFTILEDGKPRDIAVFEEVHTSVTPIRKMPANNLGVYTNLLRGVEVPKRLTVVVLDLLNTPLTDQVRAKQELIKYLSTSVTANQPIALYTIGQRGVTVIHDFTSDPEVLIAALHLLSPSHHAFTSPASGQATHTAVQNPESMGAEESKLIKAMDLGEGNSSPVMEARRRIEAMIESQDRQNTAFQMRVTATITLLAMQQIGRALQGVPGRKSVIWATAGFPLSLADANGYQTFESMRGSEPSTVRESLTGILPLYEKTWRILNEAQVALYPVDVRGLVNEMFIDASINRPSKDFYDMRSWNQQEVIGTMKTFAEMTGGRAYYNSNDIAGGFQEAEKDGENYYVLAFYLPRDSKPGWHSLSVKVNRGDVKIRARSGFFVGDPTKKKDKTSDMEIGSALESPLEFTGLNFTIRWKDVNFDPSSGKIHAGYEVSIPPGNIAIDGAAKNRFSVILLSAVKKADGTIAGKINTESFEGNLKEETVKKMTFGGVVYDNSLELTPGDYTVTFVVRDSVSGHIGSVIAPLHVGEEHAALKTETRK